ncbi:MULTISPECIES: hypothetical protein [unclassified Nostoc]|uniref:hypothetical protein n=1 Tax=unclassified Nostoc TaxID=2593658 RepID=UPI002AD4633F|nr:MULTISPECIES: hypothetical protein [unclassified Nostoc]MDZ8123877.1 hypothetical protein [Nostoc sp. CmiVER01]MDZ8222653.1 hypothetical protein [Nostoc sp. ChiVER01]
MNNWLSTTSYSSYSLLGAATDSNSIIPPITIPTQLPGGTNIPNVSPIIIIQSSQLST